MKIIIRGVEIADGSGTPLFSGDIGIDGGRFVRVGGICPGPADLTVPGSGLVAAPGFVDIHSHSDYYLLVNPGAESKVRQGVTTEIAGNCGYSAAPVLGEVREERVRVYRELLDLELPWEGVRGYFEEVRRRGTAVNLGLLAGHNTIRASVMSGSDRAPTEAESARMVEMVREAMRDGALGLSTGLIYAPACFSGLPEMIALCRAAREYRGLFTVHMRSEGNRLIEAVEEVLAVAEAAGIPLQISHLKTSGPRNWHKIDTLFARIEEARERGVDVAADRYPYVASNTGLSSVFPDWVFAGGTPRLLERLRDPAVRERIRTEIRSEHPEEDYFQRIMIAAVTRPENRAYPGTRVQEAADRAGKDPVDFICDLLLSERNLVDAIYFTMDPDNLRRILQKPYVMVGSDSGAKTLDGPLGEGNPHPRAYGTFPRVLQQFVREEKLLGLEEAVRKMTWDPLRRLGIPERGLIREGYAADLVLFDPGEIADLATYEDPKRFPAGIRMVLVNGEVVVREGEQTAARPGVVLKR